MKFIIKDLEGVIITGYDNFYEAKNKLIDLNKYGKYYLMYINEDSGDRLVTDHEYYLFGKK